MKFITYLSTLLIASISMSFGSTELISSGKFEINQESMLTQKSTAAIKSNHNNALQNGITAPVISNFQVERIERNVGPGNTHRLYLTFDIDYGGEPCDITINLNIAGQGWQPAVFAQDIFINPPSANLQVEQTFGGGDVDLIEWEIFAENSQGASNSQFTENYMVDEPELTSEPFFDVIALNSRGATLEFDTPASVGVDGYMIIATADEQTDGSNGYNHDNQPEDFVNYSVGDAVGGGFFFTEVKAVITDPLQNEVDIDFYTDETDHVVTLVPFNWNSVNPNSKNYDTDIAPTFDVEVLNINVRTPNDIDVFRQPSDLIGCNGEEERGIAILAGDSQGGDLNYQWMMDGKDLTEGVEIQLPTTESGLIFSTLSHTMSGIYTCDVWKTNETRAEGITSDPVVVFAVQQPEITKQPETVYASIGETAFMSVEANIYGELPPDYSTSVQWYIGNTALQNNDKIEGAQSSMISVSNISADDYGAEIWCTLTGYCGTVSSNTVTIMEKESVEFVQEVTPNSATYCAGEMATATASATTSMGPISYQWYANGTPLMDGTNVMGAESATLTWRVESGVNYDLTCEATVSNGETAMSMGSAYGKALPIITDSPQDAEPKSGESVTFTVMYTGDDITSVEWYRGSNTMTSIGSGDELVLDNVDASFEDTYYAEVTSDCGFDRSASATLTISTSGSAPLSVLDDNKYELNNSPNPFDSETTVRFNLDNTSNVRLVIQDAVGNLVSTPINEVMSSGNKEFRVSANKLGLTAGAYFYTLIVDGNQYTKQMIYVK